MLDIISPRLLVALVVSAIATDTDVAAQAYPAPPAPAEAEVIRGALEAMKGAERGPYEQLRWFCADGSVLPPQAGACRERGGGVQHATPSASARRLAELGFGVGTIYQALSYEAFADEERAGYRLRELVLEKYLVQVDNGWVMRRAQYYRGALQIEDEERTGRELLARRFSDAQWLSDNYFLATRLAASVPHVSLGSAGTMDRIRNLATEIAALDEGFQRHRVKIHSVPSRSDVDVVVTYLARPGHSPEVRERLERLRDDLVRHYDPSRALASLAAFERAVDPQLATSLATLRAAMERSDPVAVHRAIVELAPAVRRAAERASDGSRALDLIDLGLALQERAFALADELERTAPPATRVDRIDRFDDYVTLAYASGLLSQRERDAQHEQSARLRAAGRLPADEYRAAVGYLGRSLDWARGTVRGNFAPVLDRYALVEPAAAGFSDALLRGSVLLPLSQTLEVLQTDADALLGSSHTIFGEAVVGGVRGLNPGIAVGPLDVLEPGHHEEVVASTVYVLTETPPELKPVAGVLTLAEGNLLSHVQLLARNLGIPNATVAPTLEDRLRAGRGRDVLYAVSPMGRVVVTFADELNALERGLLPQAGDVPGVRHRLDTSRLRLSVDRPIPLSELRATASGVVVGPKAANLGQLAADFPGRVSPALALPFGMFVRHIDRPYGGSERTVLGELRATSGRAAAMRERGRSEAEIDAFVLERLTWVRSAIEGLEWIPELQDSVTAATMRMQEGDLSRGVFVRSDTNVEDLPEFSGAGLNLTVAHQTSMEQILGAIKRVWTSPFSERAYLWRSRILEGQGDVFPSVLLQQTVRSEKSGVLITSGLQEGRDDDLTIVVAEGVGGAVDGEDAETVLVDTEGGLRLLSQAKGPRRREVVSGGTRWVASRRPDVLLPPEEIAQLRSVVSTWQELKAGTPDADTTWDIEYGFVDGRLWLFQIRPFVRFRNSEVLERLATLDVDATTNAGRMVSLSDPVLR